MLLMCGETFNDHFIGNYLLSVKGKNIRLNSTK